MPISFPIATLKKSFQLDFLKTTREASKTISNPSVITLTKLNTTSLPKPWAKFVLRAKTLEADPNLIVRTVLESARIFTQLANSKTQMRMSTTLTNLVVRK